ncbi:hypothetical protein SLEP1_g622 [Rubroshorea leprosula]|uniref:Uncharacterized protein n=1 Tax=Rubroshorea leprosula TaxID=152421 RepID=A0AAV5HK41_9ROSI|nr:hypothetical protein SLEP1_g622 [Rubroshorea leprosula]
MLDFEKTQISLFSFRLLSPDLGLRKPRSGFSHPLPLFHHVPQQVQQLSCQRATLC